MAEDKSYAILTNRGAELEAAAIATKTPVIINKFVIGDANGAASVVPDPAQTELIHEVYRGNIQAVSCKNNQITFKLYLPPEVGGFTIKEMGILTSEGELYSVARSPDIIKPNGTNGAVVSITFNYILAVSSTSAVSVVIYDEYITPEVGDARYLKIDENLSEIKGNGAEAQKKARENIGIEMDSDGDVAYRNKHNTFLSTNDFNEDVTIAEGAILFARVLKIMYENTVNGYVSGQVSGVVKVHSDGKLLLSGSSLSNLKYLTQGGEYEVWHSGTLTPVKSVNNNKPDATGNVNIDVTASAVTIENIGTNQWATLSGATIIDIVVGEISSNSSSNPDVTVTLARSFPTKITSITGSFTGQGGSNEDSWWSATPINSGSFTLHTRNMNGTFSFIVKGV
ncbi:TPA: phage tail protein [Enterobacter bugandensis]|uniref:phage tail protein n=1 Tax=Enterobacter bugandensis TaxID=881260 RepID=UPI0020038D05|nr:phage tail protein [Enterobacter bugandensis]MCK7115185.1 phage tail protein [Enterobacter bugandensis]MCK7446067.1 phage tail protein [Enterobacter bugandensis]HCM9243477.1 phage tail protein [Enterobacter bugandensis]